MIAHPPGEEIQLDWIELPDPPVEWGVGDQAHLLVGALAHSGRWRAVLAESEDFPHLVQALDAVLRKLGGTAPYAASCVNRCFSDLLCDVALRPPPHRAAGGGDGEGWERVATGEM
ncbi:hypothetical protein [Streptomyces sp. NPDC060275]|uniref:hypothetical protein n=1 Tax=Streptomyces sp. NPDC060275 TaxID=3347090 RepID=UPI0036465E77